METRKLVLKNMLSEVDLIHQFLEGLGLEWGLDDRMVFELNLVLEEYFTNLVNYGYPDKEVHEISLTISGDNDQIKIEVTDDGKSFNILEMPEYDDIDKTLPERKIGGLGVHFIRSFADYLEYLSDDMNNRLVIVKKLPH